MKAMPLAIRLGLVRLSITDRSLVPPLPPVVRRRIVQGDGVIRNRVTEPGLLYFTDFLWLPNAPVADVISAARVRGS